MVIENPFKWQGSPSIFTTQKDHKIFCGQDKRGFNKKKPSKRVGITLGKK